MRTTISLSEPLLEQMRRRAALENNRTGEYCSVSKIIRLALQHYFFLLGLQKPRKPRHLKLKKAA